MHTSELIISLQIYFICSTAKSDDWTVHGIWPTRPGEKGPQFCNKSREFDFSKLKPILSKLEVRHKLFPAESRNQSIPNHSIAHAT